VQDRQLLYAREVIPAFDWRVETIAVLPPSSVVRIDDVCGVVFVDAFGGTPVRRTETIPTSAVA
jgi:hypothetical protein